MVKEREGFDSARILECGCPPTAAFPSHSKDCPDTPKVWPPFTHDGACDSISEHPGNEGHQSDSAGWVDAVSLFDHENGSLGLCGEKLEKGGTSMAIGWGLPETIHPPSAAHTTNRQAPIWHLLHVCHSEESCLFLPNEFL